MRKPEIGGFVCDFFKSRSFKYLMFIWQKGAKKKAAKSKPKAAESVVSEKEAPTRVTPEKLPSKTPGILRFCSCLLVVLG